MNLSNKLIRFIYNCLVKVLLRLINDTWSFIIIYDVHQCCWFNQFQQRLNKFLNKLPMLPDIFLANKRISLSNY